MANLFSTLEALGSLCKSVPEWTASLDELNSQIFSRQTELARPANGRQPPTHSLENKDSTESLQPKDGNDDPVLSKDADDFRDIPMNSCIPLKSIQNLVTTGEQQPSFLAVIESEPPPRKASSNPFPIESILTQHVSQGTTPGQEPLGGASGQKRKAGSLASGESKAPKYRNRSMVIVYYDSVVQTTFLELVKLISGSRNVMRKVKMQAKMMKIRAAELEMDDDGDDDYDKGIELEHKEGELVATQKKLSSGNKEESLAVRGTGNADAENQQDLSMTRMRFASTRTMGRIALRVGNLSSTLGPRSLRSEVEDVPGIPDELDKGLEWSQGQCERAAYEFLRNGECSMEIGNIKKKLAEVKEKAEKEIERLEGEEKKKAPAALDTESKGEERKLEILRPEEQEVDDPWGVDND